MYSTINNNWKEFFDSQINQQYFIDLMKFVDEEYESQTIFPPKENIFKAFELTDIKDVKVVILGQDPYHEVNQAMGLAFSVPEGEKIPPSLRNMYKELNSDLGIEIPSSGDISAWAKQGVLLINTVLTVREGEANSHKDKGWETFTDNVIKHLSKQNQPICYMLWGNHARSKKALVENSAQLVLEAAHPSPLSASRGFMGCKHFSQANDYLKNNGLSPIDYQV